MASNYDTNHVLPVFSSKFWHKKCPMQCRARCSILHHPLIVALVNCSKDSENIQEFKDLKLVFQHYYTNSDLKLNDNIPDPLEAYRLPLMHWAAALGLVSVVRWLLSEGASQHPGYPLSQRSTPLHRALIELQMNCPNDDKTRFSALLPLLWECLRLKDDEGNTVLHTSAFMVANSMPWINFHVFCFKAILDFAQRHASDGSLLMELTSMLNARGSTPLHLIARKAQEPLVLDLMAKMVEMGVSFDIPNSEGKTARRLLMPNLPNGWYSKHLMQSEPNLLLQRANLCKNPILRATIMGDVSALENLLGHHLQENNETIDDFVEDEESGNAMPLVHWAAAYGSTKVLRWLVMKGASLLPAGVDRSPLHTALNLIHPHVEVNLINSVKDILPYLLPCLSVADVEGDTPLHSCLKLMAQSNQNTELTEFYVRVFNLMFTSVLRENVSVLNHANKNGDNLLHLALRSEQVNVQICQRLIQANVDRNAQNSSGETPAAMIDNPQHPCSSLLVFNTSEVTFTKGQEKQKRAKEAKIKEEEEEAMEVEEVVEKEEEDEEEKEEDSEVSEPVITIEKDGKMIDLVGEKDIVAFLSTLKAPSPTLSNFYMHILKTRDTLAKKLSGINEKARVALKKLEDYEELSVNYTEKKTILDEKSETLNREESELLLDINSINQQIKDSDKTCIALQETLAHCQGALSVLTAEEKKEEDEPMTPLKLHFESD
ncbi:hypothetical protein CAPTEDRAFT_213583 [Capitella teleta]|uniref:Uncharacterized protein n=1 Tax=Capitella teleta TaxID=283909 RepID=R7VCL3_CAPTE|nr:hypothetical protein CAPTEDRAFT_213583 [Capitella teleta]|eukprot:ELU16369.1 hypothetical protein CAPTEDRAFT_213583 [Capitella teleta]